MMLRTSLSKARSSRRRRCLAGAGGFTLTDALALLAALSLFGVLFLPARSRLADDARMQLCMDNLSQIARAVTFYSQDNAAFAPVPPLNPKTGKPHQWTSNRI